MASLAKEHGLIERYHGGSTDRPLDRFKVHEERAELITMLLQLAQGEGQVLDQVAGLPPTLPAGPEMATEALNLMGEETSPQRALGLSCL